MDLLIYVLLVVLIGIFFFLDKYTKTQNAMFIVIILTFIGFIFVQNTNIEIVDYTTVVKINSTHQEFSSIDITNSGLGIFDTQAFIVLIFFFFLMLSSINLFIGKEER